jgi:methionyl-tRNA formyltransferase
VNLHISYLPFNRGAHPNVWSWIEGSPSGVSIHLIDEGIDTGPIIERKFVEIDTKTNTLESSYRVLQQEVVTLFKKHLNSLLENQFTAEKQTQEGTIHKTSQLDEISSLLTHGWDTVLESLQTNNKKLRMKNGFPLSGCLHKTS